MNSDDNAEVGMADDVVIRPFIDIPDSVLQESDAVQNAWDLINDDTFEDISFTRAIFNNHREDAERNREHPDPVWTAIMVLSLIERRCPQMLDGVDLTQTNREALIRLYLNYVRDKKSEITLEKLRLTREKRTAMQFKLMAGLRNSLICKSNHTSVSRFVAQVAKFQSDHKIDKKIVYTNIASPARLANDIYKAWQSTEEAQSADPAPKLDPLLTWLYKEYVGEQQVMDLKGELLNLRQGDDRLADFMKELVAKLNEFRCERTTATKYLTNLSVGNYTDDQLYNHIRDNQVLNADDFTQMCTDIPGHSVMDWTSMQEAAKQIAARKQPQDKRGIKIRGCIQTSNKRKIESTNSNGGFSKFSAPPLKRQKLKDSNNFDVASSADANGGTGATALSVSKYSKKRLKARKKQLQKELFSIEKAQRAFGGRGKFRKGFGNRRERKNVTCYRCGFKGHVKADCKVPEHRWKRNKRYVANQLRDFEQKPQQKRLFDQSGNKKRCCFNCGSPKHLLNKCPKKLNQAHIRAAKQKFQRSRQNMMIIDCRDAQRADQRAKNVFDDGQYSFICEESKISEESCPAEVFENLNSQNRFKRLEQLEYRKYGLNDRTICIEIDNFGKQTVYIDGGTTIDIIDRRLAAQFEHLVQRCRAFGVQTAGGISECNSFIQLRIKVQRKGQIKECLIKWYILRNVDLPHRWMLSRGSLNKLGWTDVLVELDELNNDVEFKNKTFTHISYSGDAGPWTEKSYPLPSQCPRRAFKRNHRIKQRK